MHSLYLFSKIVLWFIQNKIIKHKVQYRVKIFLNINTLVSRSSCNAIISGAGGLRFKSQPGQIGHSVVNSLLRRFFEKSFVFYRRVDAEMGFANSVHASAKYSEYNERDLISFTSVTYIVIQEMATMAVVSHLGARALPRCRCP